VVVLPKDGLHLQRQGAQVALLEDRHSQLQNTDNLKLQIGFGTFGFETVKNLPPTVCHGGSQAVHCKSLNRPF
jgi:hypothetical protein